MSVSSNQFPQILRSRPLKNIGVLASSSRVLLRRTVLPPLLAPTLFLEALVTLRFSRVEFREGLDLVLGATMTSASGAILAKGWEEARGGTSEVTIIFAVEVGDRWSVRGCGMDAVPLTGA